MDNSGSQLSVNHERLSTNTSSQQYGHANTLLRLLYTMEHSGNKVEHAKAMEDVSTYLREFCDDDINEEDDFISVEDNHRLQECKESKATNDQPISNYSSTINIAHPSEAQQISSNIQVTTAHKTMAPPELEKQTTETHGSHKFIDRDNIMPECREHYEKLQKIVEEYERSCSQINGQQSKELIPPLRAILNKLCQDTYKTLSGELIKYLAGANYQMGNKIIHLSNNNERIFCLKKLSTLILDQFLGSDLNDTKTTIFLPLIEDLSKSQKEFANIFLYLLYTKCPYTVPYYPQRELQMSDTEYKRALGYEEKKEGDIVRLESEIEFLNRMSGYIRVFCKLTCCNGPPFNGELKFAWTWFCSILNLLPRSNVTAVCIRIFLQEIGERMSKTYGKQNSKLLQYVENEYMQKLRNVTTEDQLIRLQIVLKSFSTQP